MYNLAEKKRRMNTADAFCTKWFAANYFSPALTQGAVMKYLAVLVIAVLTSCAFCATTYYVDANRPDDSGNGLTWATAKQTIQAAVDLAASGDTVLATNGIYGSGGRVTPGYALSNRVVIGSGIVVASVNERDATVISGAADPQPGGLGTNAVRCAYLAAGAVLRGFTLSNGHTLAAATSVYDLRGGGALVNVGAVLAACAVCHCRADRAGGALCWLGGTIDGCVFAANSGPGIEAIGMSGSKAAISNTLVTGTSGAVDGGIAAWDTWISHCVLSGNVALADGGGVYCGQNTVIDNTLLCANQAQRGGGIAFYNNVGEARNCTIAGNHAADAGGGVHALGSNGVCINTIIMLNDAPAASNWHAGTAYLACCTSPLAGLPGAGQCQDADPLFSNAAGGDYHIDESSPCVNAGTNLPWTTGAVDLDGNPRILPASGIVDIGAYEAVPEPAILWAFLAWITLPTTHTRITDRTRRTACRAT
jgi:hypothetical protein